MSPAFINRQVLSDSIYVLLLNSVFDVHLFVNNYTITVDTALASLVEASYDSYPPGGITPALPTWGSVGNEEAISTVGVTFPAPIASGPVNIYGFYVRYLTRQGNVNKILMAAQFPGAPIVLTNGGPTLPILINLNSLDVNNP
jgi:hypothetical protein